LSDLITLRIPATTGHVGLARATASALAARLDFTYDRLTDLHIAIDEVCGRLLATSDPPPRRLELTFAPEDDGLRITVMGDTPLKPGAVFLNPWSKVILDSIVQDLEVRDASQDGAVSVTFRVARGDGD
jgi:serine/threonine-protein kinase RsbW